MQSFTLHSLSRTGNYPTGREWGCITSTFDFSHTYLPVHNCCIVAHPINQSQEELEFQWFFIYIFRPPAPTLIINDGPLNAILLRPPSGRCQKWWTHFHQGLTERHTLLSMRHKFKHQPSTRILGKNTLKHNTSPLPKWRIAPESWSTWGQIFHSFWYLLNQCMENIL